MLDYSFCGAFSLCPQCVYLTRGDSGGRFRRRGSRWWNEGFLWVVPMFAEEAGEVR